ncbi:hypothetical protein ACFLXT_05335 [Chloroflexota bacterium]
MSHLTGMMKHPCWADFNCYYKVDNGCTFGDEAKAICLHEHNNPIFPFALRVEATKR